MARILIIDGDARDQERLASFLDRHEVVRSSGGADALQRLRDASDSVELAIMSWELEGIPSAPDLLVELRRRFLKIRVIVTSSLMDWSIAPRARTLGAEDFILKPLDRYRVLDSVEGILGRLDDNHLSAITSDFVGNSENVLKPLRTLARALGNGSEPILLIGETGTGKEVLARAVHPLKPDTTRPWIAVNISTVPPQLMESELFGHEKGAFTDASKLRTGVFERCGEGTLFLDEIGELELPLQAKLLRVIQERKFSRVGGEHELEFSGRLVLATNRNLVTEVAQGRFRQDLYHRISIHEIRLPPLRERGDDLWLIVDHMLKLHGKARQVKLSRETAQLLSTYQFPGNVRELENIIIHGLNECDGDKMLPFHLPLGIMQERRGEIREVIELPLDWQQMPHKEAIKEIERCYNRKYLAWLLEQSNHNVTAASRTADMDPKTFRSKWKEAGLGDI